MEISEVVTIAAASIAVLFLFVYVVASIIKDASIIDIAWGVAQIVIAGSLLVVVDENYSFVRILVSMYAIAWGVRLALHIGSRKIGEPEDKRYQKWRKDWGETYWWRSILQVYVLQALLALLMSAPVIVVSLASNLSAVESTWLVAVGSAVWWYGFIFETLGDWQLRQFLKTKKKGEIMTSGLWQYTRHPNYFGEVTQWWGLWLIVASLDYGLFALVSPLLITVLILKVSGITMLEKRYDDDKAYQKYKKKTSAFFPLPKQS